MTLLKVGKILKEKDSKTFLSMPAPMQIWQAVTENDNTDCPVTVPSGKKWLSEYAQNHKMYELKPENILKHSDKEAVSLNDIWFRYEKSGTDVLKGLSLKIYQGNLRLYSAVTEWENQPLCQLSVHLTSHTEAKLKSLRLTKILLTRS